MQAQLPLDVTFILSIWFETLCFGIYIALFSATVVVILRRKKHRTFSSKVTFETISVLFVLTSIHASLKLYRILEGYIWRRDFPGGPPEYFLDVRRWDHVLKNWLYTTQILVANGFAIYRCWHICGKSYYTISLPLLLWIFSVSTSGIICWLFMHTYDPRFEDPLRVWIITFHCTNFVQNFITTGLITRQLLMPDYPASEVITPPEDSTYMHTVRVVIESAVIYVIADFLLLVLSALGQNTQVILLECMPPVVGIVFTAIALRLSLHRSVSRSSAGSRMTNGPRPPTVHIRTRSSATGTESAQEGTGSQVYEGRKPNHNFSDGAAKSRVQTS